MIPRYVPSDIGKIWSDENKYNIWFQVELAACEAMEEAGLVPTGVSKSIRARKPFFSIAKIRQIEQSVKHDVIAFLTYLEQQAGPDARWLHRGMTSSDVVDTAFAMQMRESLQALISRCAILRSALSDQARRYAHIPMMGRSHGMAAEPITFGLALAGHYAEITRCQTRLYAALDVVSYGKISGAVGTYAHLSPEIERKALVKLQLLPEWVSTQVVPRDRHAEAFLAIASTASGLERFATNMRHWQRSEVSEAMEPFGGAQKGSSAMPHKRNPIISENICGLSRIVRSYCTPALENVALWHERDISHSSAERIMAPDATSALAYMLDKVTSVVEDMEVDQEQMLANIENAGELYASEAVLLEMVQKGMERQTAYKIVQSNAMKALGGSGTFRSNLKKDPQISIAPARIDELFDLQHALRWVPEIIERALAHKP